MKNIFEDDIPLLKDCKALYTINEVAKKLKYKPLYIRKLLTERKLGFWKVAGRVFISDIDIKNYIKAKHYENRRFTRI